MSIHFPVLQGSYEWRMCRLGLPTASALSRILTPKKLDISKPGIASLASELVAERAMMKPLEVDLAGFAERGTMLEDEAVPWYEMQTNTDVERSGFVFDPDRMVGASPDGLTKSGGLEVKSLSPAKHLRMIVGGDIADYRAQVQACMLVCERPTWDLLFYHPSLPSKIYTIECDAEYLEIMEIALAALREAVDELMERAGSAGVGFHAWGEHLEDRRRGEVPVDPALPRSAPKFDMFRGAH